MNGRNCQVAQPWEWLRPRFQTDQAVNRILNRGGRPEVRDWRVCGVCSGGPRRERPLASGAWRAEPEDLAEMRPELRSARSTEGHSRDSWSSVREWSALERNWATPGLPFLPFQQTWSSGEHHGGGSRQAGAFLHWPEASLRAVLAKTVESNPCKACAAS